MRIEGDRIVHRAKRLPPRPGETVLDCGDALLAPAWINAHVHLELSLLEGTLPRGEGFVPWVRALVTTRSGKGEAFFAAGVRRGLGLALRSGTGTLGEVTTTGVSGEILRESGLTSVVFEETIAPHPEQAEAALVRVGERVDRLGPADAAVRPGVAPHAPYTVSEELLRGLAALAERRGLPLSVHLSETEEEVRMFERGDGPLVDFLRSLGAVPGGWTSPRCRPVAWLDGLGILRRRPLLVHCNYLDDDDIERIGSSGASVVFCPRSHRFFGHREHPFRRLRDRGVPVALGTDSLASNDTLSMLDEVRELARVESGLAPSELFTTASEGGARALGLEGEIGRIAAGCRADLVAYPLGSDASRDDALETVLGRAGDPSLLVAGGGVHDFREGEGN